MTQVKMPVQAKLEMARNFWDEMGRGSEKGMHGPMLERLAGFFQLSPAPRPFKARLLDTSWREVPAKRTLASRAGAALQQANGEEQ